MHDVCTLGAPLLVVLIGVLFSAQQVRELRTEMREMRTELWTEMHAIRN